MVLRSQEAWGLDQFRQTPANAATLNTSTDFHGMVLTAFVSVLEKTEEEQIDCLLNGFVYLL